MEENLLEKLVRVLCSCNRACTVQEIADHINGEKMIDVRKALSELHRRGVVSKEPDYERRKLVFRVRPEYCE
ncbi:hypothetical protein D1872_322640 [compost metagenome]